MGLSLGARVDKHRGTRKDMISGDLILFSLKMNEMSIIRQITARMYLMPFIGR